MLSLKVVKKVCLVDFKRRFVISILTNTSCVIILHLRISYSHLASSQEYSLNQLTWSPLVLIFNFIIKVKALKH